MNNLSFHNTLKQVEVQPKRTTINQYGFNESILQKIHRLQTIPTNPPPSVTNRMSKFDHPQLLLKSLDGCVPHLSLSMYECRKGTSYTQQHIYELLRKNQFIRNGNGVRSNRFANSNSPRINASSVFAYLIKQEKDISDLNYFLYVWGHASSNHWEDVKKARVYKPDFATAWGCLQDEIRQLKIKLNLWVEP